MWPLSSSTSTAALTLLLLCLPLVLLPFLPSTHAFNLLSLCRQPQPLQERTAAQPYQQLQYDDLDESSSSTTTTNQNLGLLDRVPSRTRTLENIRCPHCLSVNDEVFVISPPPVPSPPSSSRGGGGSRSAGVWEEEGEGGREAWRPSPGIIPSHLSTSDFTRRLYRDKPWMKRG